eukprot:CAMPEP_0201933648 /NCGR_PEP_ID=MMETSP0903-20130614/32020_1 /ASSEMBLY_ACC=CAM_ASM_000552 /TAXON_ID=420261 /ORGANISM="Thalassiosira antarctica, Strain CCMP982" /LENGTH=42 /DNA_ID= /DNA_START= /DNA_END= /DNA_ORIENTATION=
MTLSVDFTGEGFSAAKLDLPKGFIIKDLSFHNERKATSTDWV